MKSHAVGKDLSMHMYALALYFVWAGFAAGGMLCSKPCVNHTWRAYEYCKEISREMETGIWSRFYFRICSAAPNVDLLCVEFATSWGSRLFRRRGRKQSGVNESHCRHRCRCRLQAKDVMNSQLLHTGAWVTARPGCWQAPLFCNTRFAFEFGNTAGGEKRNSASCILSVPRRRPRENVATTHWWFLVRHWTGPPDHYFHITWQVLRQVSVVRVVDTQK